MDTKQLLHEYIKERTKIVDVFPDIVNRGIDTIAGEVPTKLKIAITLSELITFAGHLRKSIKLFDGTRVPVNAIVFALSASGTSKDKSLNSIRKALQTAYDHLEAERQEYAKDKAREAAAASADSSNWARYYHPPKPLQAGLGTTEGLMHHFADIASNSKGAGSVLSTEIGNELQTNGEMTNIIKVISQAYDLGKIDPKIVKSQENQTAGISGLPVNALFFGSQEAILFDNAIKAKFKLIFNTQLARRSIFVFTPENPARIEIKSVEELHTKRNAERVRVVKACNEVDKLVMELVSGTSKEPLTLTDEANKLFDIYQEYNSILSDEASNKYPISKLSRKHKQWLALKISGAYAILLQSPEIDEEIYAYAINTVEYLAGDLSEFEKELIKEPYAQLVDMCHYNAEEGEFEVSLHELREMSYIAGSGSSIPKVEELVKLANSYDPKGTYEVVDNGIKFKEFIKSDIVGVSYIIFNTTSTGPALKEYMARNSASGYTFYETEFPDIQYLLKENAAYSSFAFVNGERSKENLIGSTKFVVLDIDKSYITDTEAHELVNDYNHFIVRTSDPDNEFKFRVILELDAPVEISERMWKPFISEIAEELGLTIDPLPQSQIFLSFKDREVLSQLKGKTLNTKKFIYAAQAKMSEAPKDPKSLPNKVKDQKLKDPRETFSFAFEAQQGERSKKIYRALAYAIDLGADEDYLETLGHEINNYMTLPMPKDRLERTLLNPAIRKLQ